MTATQTRLYAIGCLTMLQEPMRIASDAVRDIGSMYATDKAAELLGASKLISEWVDRIDEEINELAKQGVE